jgi:hypothetical protein
MTQLVDQQRAHELQTQAQNDGDLLIWTVYERPNDHPNYYVARPWSIQHQGPLGYRLQADNLEALRGQIPPGLTRKPRMKADEPAILETWT